MWGAFVQSCGHFASFQNKWSSERQCKCQTRQTNTTKERAITARDTENHGNSKNMPTSHKREAFLRANTRTKSMPTSEGLFGASASSQLSPSTHLVGVGVVVSINSLAVHNGEQELRPHDLQSQPCGNVEPIQSKHSQGWLPPRRNTAVDPG